ncbi:MAG: alanine racemase [Desulfobacteraceae bacterium]|nr:alanine racemase [Desulfobacteraceae bacterium]
MKKNSLQITDRVPTPFLLIEEEIVKKNISRIHKYADKHGFAVRPHIKTHKSLEIARMHLDSGAVGLAAAKVGEAEVMAGLGPVDLTVAYPAIGQIRAERIAKLSVKQRVRVAVDTQFAMDELAGEAVKHGTTIGVLVMFDAGLHRCGISDPGQVVKLARYAEATPGLCFDGIQLYLGHLYDDAARNPESFERINLSWEPVHEALCNCGLKPATVSSGSTPSLENTHLVRHITEIRVGTAILNDYFVMKYNHCTMEECAARVVATVVSDVMPGRVIIDAGSKALSAKQLLRHESLEMGYVAEYPDARIIRLHEEHGWVDISRCNPAPKLGERLSIIPVNASLCVNLYDHFHMITSDGGVQKERVDARGCLV